MTDVRKLRVLCLHGYHGSGAVLRDQMRSLVAETESIAEYLCVDAPSRSAGDFGWWHAVDDPTSSRQGDPGVDGGGRHYKGWSRARDWLLSTFAQQGPFDGVFGFSQGASLAGLVVGLRAPGGTATETQPLAFDFAVLVSGFRSNDPRHAPLYAARESFALPSLHIVGRRDVIVPPVKSFDLASAFTRPTMLEHDGGHVIASTREIRSQYRVFLDRARSDRARSDRARSELGGIAVIGGSGHVAPIPDDPAPPIDVPLWPEREHPAMRVVFPETRRAEPTPAILVFQGGAYATCAGSGGGSAEWIAKQGMVGVRVEYRTQSTLDAYPANYADAARAVRLVRSSAAERNIDPGRIGVLGYSAGGHLASLLSTRPTLYTDPSDDLADRVSARPDLVVLAYPLISFVDGYAPGAFVGSVDSFFGRRGVEESVRRGFSNELYVDQTHPPVFIWTTRDDALVPYTHSQLFADACRRANVPVRFELYPHGPHGLGLAFQHGSDVRDWTTQLLEWLTERWGA